MKYKFTHIFWDFIYYSGLNAFFLALRRGRLTVLGYHSISDPLHRTGPHSDIYKHLSVSAAAFEEQLRWLQAHKYTFLRFSDFKDIREQKRRMPKRPVLLYFDDGYRDNYTNAYPILKRLGIPAAVFVVTDCLDKKRLLWETVLHPQDADIFLSWEELRSMRDVFEVGTHTVTHRKLTSLAPEEVREEFVRSRAYIEEQMGVPVVAVSYPKSRFTEETRKIAAECGFEFILAHGRGFRHSADFRYLEKIPVGPEDAMRTFKLKLGLYYPIMNILHHGAAVRRA